MAAACEGQRWRGRHRILAWRVAGYYGVDRWLLPLLGTPWTGTLTKVKTVTVGALAPDAATAETTDRTPVRA
jgi:hypothetical protein